MAQTIVRTDDIDGSPDADQVLFLYEGKTYEIDLGADNKKEFDEYMADLLKVARVVSNAPTSAKVRRTVQTGASDASKIREWATANGHEVTSRGRISADLRAAYDEANPTA